MLTTDVLKEVKSFLEKRVIIDKAPRVKRNLKIINLILDGFSYQEIADTLGISRQAVGEIISNSKKLYERNI